MTAETSPQSALGQLKARRQKIADELVLKLEVPGWSEPRIVVHYKPVEHEVIDKALRPVEKAKRDHGNVVLNANLDVLIQACIKVEAIDPDEEWDGFDDQLAESLGVENPTARKTCRALFFADGHAIAHASRLAEWLGYSTNEIDEAFEGE